jgi:DNA mismatch endonuclease (patch repair protein)
LKDPLSPEERSKRMSLVRSKDTKPEMRVRRIIHAMGYRYSLHPKNLSGRPDIVFPRRRKIVFVHGCFWHQHTCAMGARMPKSRVEFWQHKLHGNKKRDAKIRRRLCAAGWSVLVIWECQTTAGLERLARKLGSFLGPHPGRAKTSLRKRTRTVSPPTQFPRPRKWGQNGVKP